MEIRWHIVFIIVGAAIVTFIPRILPLVALSRIQLPSWALQWLKHVPIAIMAALIGQELFAPQGEASFFINKAELIAALLTFTAAMITRSLLGTVLIGILSMFALRLFI
ncbi:AzlD domain-containing protein [Paenibacillus sp.]|uniref:AzlD domain-containing protein n=1 Tax=Paenibacillus sp. TaxID=58172 RepID=UPI00356AF445